MPRYVAFLRGVMPTNAKMPELKRCFEEAGFTDVRTILGSGNVAFSARAASEAALERKAEAAMAKRLGRSFYTIVRPSVALSRILDADPFAAFRLPANAKRVVTFLREPHKARLALPIEVEGARILAMEGREIFTAAIPSPRGPVFMTLIEKTFGAKVTTRTWDTIRKCAAAQAAGDEYTVTAEEFRKMALSLPGASEGSHMGHPDFRVGGKIFATLGAPDPEWGMVKLTPDDQELFVHIQPKGFQPVKGGWGRQGATSVRLKSAKKETVREALRAAWRERASKNSRRSR